MRVCSVLISLLAHRFVSGDAFGKIRFWWSTSRYSYCFLSGKWAAIQTIRCDTESHNGEEIESLNGTAKLFSGDFDLVRTKRQWALLILDFAPECMSQPIFRSEGHF